MKALVAALVLLTAAPAAAQVLREQDYTLRGETFTRVCHDDGTGACDRAGFSTENHEQVLVITDAPFTNVAINAENASTEPDDWHALACHNAFGSGGAVMQACAYGTNYPGTLSGLPLAGRAKVVGYTGLVFGTYSGPTDFVADGTHVARYWHQGFGFGAFNYGARNALSLGWGQCTSAPAFGEVTMCAMPGPGGVYHLYAITSNGGQTCLTCP